MRLFQMLLWLLVCFAVAVMPTFVKAENFLPSEEELLAESTREMHNFLCMREEILDATARAFASLECPVYIQDEEYVQDFFESAFEGNKMSAEWFSKLMKKVADLSGDSVKVEISNEFRTDLDAHGAIYQTVRVTSKNGFSTLYILTPSTFMGCSEVVKEPVKYSFFKK